jgi:DNA polymerase-3 subunit gamma/tau
MSFYRIYRPQTIAEIDNVSVRDQLLSLVKKKKEDLPHAFFFSGPKGAGKTTAARIIAKLFNCQKPKKDGPCGECGACLSIAEGSYIDVLEIDAASNRGIDDVRELRDKIKLSPAIGQYKVYVIDEVHMMTNEAFNALLKTLEEPPKHAVFILATTDPQKVPVTVRSRCMEIKFSKASSQELVSSLERIISNEHMTIDEEAVSLIARIADGAFRDAVKLLEQASFIEGPITPSKLSSILSASDVSQRESFLSTVLIEKDQQKAIMEIEKFASDGIDMRAFLSDCLSDLQRALIFHLTNHVMGTLYIQWHPEHIRLLSKKFMVAFDDLKRSPIQQLPVELAVIEYLESYPKPAHPISSEPKEDKGKPETTPTMRKVESIPFDQKETTAPQKQPENVVTYDHLNLEKLLSHWPDFIESLKPYNHSVAGVIRSARPKSVENGVVTIEAFYKFHQERLSEARVRDILASVLKQLFGVPVRVDIVLGKK